MKILESRGVRLLLEVSRRSVGGFFEHDMSTYAAALAYRALFALFPFFAFLVGLLGVLGVFGFFFDWLIEQARSALQEQYAGLWEQAIRQIQYQPQGELLLSVIVIAAWSGSRGANSLTKALNTVHEVGEFRPAWKRLLLQLFFAPGLAIVMILAIALLLIGPRVIEWIVGLVGLDEVFIFLWAWLRLPVALVLLMLTVSMIYWVVPNVDRPFRLITSGAILAVIVWVIASLGFSFYLANFANYSVTYGSLGVAVALLLYFYISAAVLLLGAEVNAAIYRVSDRKAREEERGIVHETPGVEGGSRENQ